MISPVNIGSAPNDGTGDRLRDAFAKCNKPIAGYNSTTHVWTDSDWQAAMADFVANYGRFESAQVDIPLNTSYGRLHGSFAHGLGRVPRFVRGVFVCQYAHTDDSVTYALGDELSFEGIWDSSSVVWYSLHADATNIYYEFETLFTRADFGGTRWDGSGMAMWDGTNNFWKVKFYASL